MRELADRAQEHRTFIGAVERAETNVSIDNIARISAALGVRPVELLLEEREAGWRDIGERPPKGS